MHNRQTEIEYDLDALIRNRFALEQQDIRTYSPLTLAYIGDAIYELILRSIVVRQGNKQVNKLHRQASRFAKAQAQSEMVETLLPLLLEEELQIYKRGRNAKSYTTAKNASVNDYRRATGFEALMGYLYLNGNTQRLVELVKTAVESYTPEEHTGMETRNRCEQRQIKEEV